MVVGYIGVHPGGRWVRSGSLDSLGCALGVVGFDQGRWVHWGAPWGSYGSFGFIGVHHVARRVRLWSLGSLWCAMGLIGFTGFIWVHPGHRQIRSG